MQIVTTTRQEIEASELAPETRFMQAEDVVKLLEEYRDRDADERRDGEKLDGLYEQKIAAELAGEVDLPELVLGEPFWKDGAVKMWDAGRVISIEVHGDVHQVASELEMLRIAAHIRAAVNAHVPGSRQQ